MAYFPNGTAGEMFEAEWCNRCRHRGPDDGPGCSVWLLHLLWNYEQHRDEGIGKAKKEALDVLIRETDKGAECTMFASEEHPESEFGESLKRLRERVSDIRCRQITAATFDTRTELERLVDLLEAEIP